jgi:glutamine amidotransferase
LTGDPERIVAAHGVVVPGVGAFPEGMRRLESAGLDEVVRERAAAGVPVLGICLGMQLLFESSTEHEGADGLGLIPGTVTALETGGAKLPHIGWNEVSFLRPGALVEGLGPSAAFYHVHTYVCRPSDREDVVGVGEYGERFVSIVERGNVLGAQFHPEKSSRAGLALLGNFVSACPRVPA